MSHDIKIATGDEVQVGETRSLSLTIAARAGHSISRDGPLYVDVSTIEADTGAEPIVALPKRRYQRSDAADVHADAPRYDVRYRGLTPGETIVRVSLFFWVCGTRTCWPVRESRDVRIHVRLPDQ